MADRPPPAMPTGQMPSSFDENHDFYNERSLNKIFRKIKEEPLIPLGCGLTVFAFVSAWRATRRGDSQQANKMFRARVYAQGFTVVAMVAGSMYYNKDREKTKELRKLKEEHDAEEKRRKWIRELEVRDQEEKALKTHLKEKAAAAAATVEDKVKQVEGETSAEAGTGGILGKMGLWSQAEKAVAEEAKAKAEAQEVEGEIESGDKKSRNPKSSLGTLGEIMASQKKDGSKDDPKK